MIKLIVIVFISLLLIKNAFAGEPYVEEALLEKISKKYKLFAKKRFLFLQETLDGLKDKSDLEKLKGVNSFFNDVPYSTDLKTYNKRDYWATPWEFLGKDRGDCEDYVISKYFALRYLGVDPTKLFFTYARSTKFKSPHMVLTYFNTPRSEPLILDNNNHKVLPASKRTDLIPIYNFNGEVLNKSGKKQKSHKKWDQLNLNMTRKKI